MVTCAQCSRDVPVQLVPDAKFCPNCGIQLALTPMADSGGDFSTTSLPAIVEAAETATISDADVVEEPAGLSEADAAAIESLPAGSAMLLVLRGPSAGSRFLLDTDLVTAGRHQDSDVFLDDVTVSRRHAEFRRQPDAGAYQVIDVGSLNGTYVNRDRVDAAVLHNGDEVQIGKYRLVYYQGTAP
jgi:pSer/pThr/pTyr-binding forkhead associated (FHA) protein